MCWSYLMTLVWMGFDALFTRCKSTLVCNWLLRMCFMFDAPYARPHACPFLMIHKRSDSQKNFPANFTKVGGHVVGHFQLYIRFRPFNEIKNCFIQFVIVNHKTYHFKIYDCTQDAKLLEDHHEDCLSLCMIAWTPPIMLTIESRMVYVSGAYKVCGCHSVNFLQWCVVMWRSKNNHLKDTSSNQEIEPLHTSEHNKEDLRT